jgi:hypothetical protein
MSERNPFDELSIRRLSVAPETVAATIVVVPDAYRSGRTVPVFGQFAPTEAATRLDPSVFVRRRQSLPDRRRAEPFP